MSMAGEFTRLVDIMARLRDRENGCPWDIEQDFSSIRHFTIEEAYEVADAIERADFEDLCAELGDLILQPVFHAQMAAEAELFTIEDVLRGINDKLVRRHPHIFTDEKSGLNSSGVLEQWEQIKEGERRERASRRGGADQETNELEPGVLEDVPRALPALLRAEKLSRRAAKAGFDWADVDGVLNKCREELEEVDVEIRRDRAERVHDEIGDLLFAVVNLARKSGVSPEAALSDANAKFVRRFRHVEKRCREDGTTPQTAGMPALQTYWEEVRKNDKENPGS